jgi:N-glycosylase/DNA lyase
MTEPASFNHSLHGTVKVICDLITKRIAVDRRATVKAEADLRYELVACLLGSQVRAESADKALDRLCSAGLLADKRWQATDKNFENEVSTVLADQHAGDRQRSSHRFPLVRAKQIAQMREVLQFKPLSERLPSGVPIKDIRAGLVCDMPGIGPKQASMFLRNIGMSYDIAILDVHVLAFFQRLGLLPEDRVELSSLKRYEQTEIVASRYAAECGHPVGLIDWAIWITMRAAKELRV